MSLKENKIQISRTGVYYTDGVVSSPISWFCCHGYGQMATYMTKKLKHQIENNEYVVSVEGPNRFYWKGVTGDPVTTWMTKHHRLDEIRDNNQYLSQVYESTILQNNRSKKILLGFSQGGTTIWRWIHECKPEFDVFICYAGWIPEDIDLSILKDYLKAKQLIFVYGAEDEYLTVDRVELIQEIIRTSGLSIQVIKTTGKHSINKEVIGKIMNSII